MFYHGYNSYLENGFDFDELKPLTCEGVQTWGNFHLTTIDALDTLVVMGNYSEFNRLVKFIEENVDFDYDLNVSTFETNIRVIGGLLSAHLLSHKTGLELDEHWPCDGPLLRLAEKMARKLLPAFDTPTSMPYGTVNLLHGVPFNETTITCTAGVGTFILEFGTLTRLTGDEVFERVALKAIKSLHNCRSSIDLLGNHINITDGSWTAVDSSIGGSVDSFYEYLVKGSVYLNIPQLFEYFEIYLKSIRKYMKKDDWHFLVNMHTGQITNPIFQSLDSFWPGLLTLIGHLDEAKKVFLNNHHVWKQFGFLPEFYDVLNNEIKRNGYPLRPEHVESMFYLYRATRDPIFLNHAVDILESIEYSARTECGFATVKDVRDHSLEDRMESFFLGETLKYLYLIFDHENFIYNDGRRGIELNFKDRNDQPASCVIDAGNYIFNTEAHIFDGSILYCCSSEKIADDEFVTRLVKNVNYRNVIENRLLDDLIVDKDVRSDRSVDHSVKQVDQSVDRLAKEIEGEEIEDREDHEEDREDHEDLETNDRPYERAKRKLSDEILDDRLEIDGLDCELNKNYCLKLELKQTNYSHCGQPPFLFTHFAKYGEVLSRDSVPD